MNKERKPIYLYKGDDTVFDGINKITLTVKSESIDLSRFSALFQLGDFKQVGSLVDGMLKVELTRDYTDKFMFGPMKGIIRLIDERGRVKTIINNLDFYVTNDLSLLEHNEDITIDDIKIDDETYNLSVTLELPLTHYGDLEGLPSLNGVIIKGNKTDEDYSLQHKLEEGENVKIENNVISVPADEHLNETSTKPVQNQAVYKAALDISRDLEEHVADDQNPHNVTAKQVGLGNVDNTSDADKPISTAVAEAFKKISDDLTAHKEDVNNPHKVTKEQVGLSEVDNTSDEDKPLSAAAREANEQLADDLQAHKDDKNNPHGVTKTQVGLGNVDNTADMDKPVSTAVEQALAQKQPNLTQEQLAAVNSGADSTKIANIAENARAIADINAKVPTQASEDNQLADKEFVNSTVATNTANFIGTFNSLESLEAYAGELTNNDYAFVVTLDAEGNTVYNRYKYSTAVEPAAWVFEYPLNNSSFTAAQWAAIQSGITAALVSSYNEHLANSDIHVTAAQKTAWTAKQDALTATQLTAVNSGIDSSKVAQIATNASNITSLENNKLDKTTAANTYIPLTQKAAANGVATLDANKLVPAAQLPAATASVKGTVIVDTDLSDTSANPVQNKAVKAELDNCANQTIIRDWEE